MKIEVQRENEIGVDTLKNELLKEFSGYLELNNIRSYKFQYIELCKVTAVATFLEICTKWLVLKIKKKPKNCIVVDGECSHTHRT